MTCFRYQIFHLHGCLDSCTFALIHVRLVSLQIAQTSTSADISKAWKRLSKVVHPDRCKLPRADEAFIKIKASVDALQSTGA